MIRLNKIVPFIIIFHILFFLSLACGREKLKDDDHEDFVPGDQDSSHVVFFILSDWGTHGSRTQKEVAFRMAELAEKINLDFIVTGGDNFYDEGVKSVYDPLWEKIFINIYNYSSLKVNWYPTLGNHDYYGNPQAQVEYSGVNNYWNMPARFYTFVKEIDPSFAVRFIMLDTEGFLTEYNETDKGESYKNTEQYQWMENVLSASEEEWLIVVGHHAIYSAGSSHGGSPVLKNIFEPLFEMHEVDFYISGHDHHFEHARSENSGIDFFVTGTGGEVRPSGENENTVYSVSIPGFVYMSVGKENAELFFITNKGETAYAYIRNLEK